MNLGSRNRRRVDQKAVRAAAAAYTWRTLKALGYVALLVGICAAAALGGAWGRDYLHSSPSFAIEKFKFDGVHHASEEELAGIAGIAVGDNIFQADLSAAQKAIAAHPWVRQVTIERSYPHALVVRVVEHQPAALVDLGGLYYLNDAGKAFKKLVPGEEADWPILRGITREEYVAHEEETEGLFREALTALNVYREAGLEKLNPVSEVKIDRMEGLIFYCGKDATAVKLGFKEYSEKFARLEKLFSEFASRGVTAEVIHLDNRARPNWVPVQLAQGTGTAAGKQ